MIHRSIDGTQLICTNKWLLAFTGISKWQICCHWNAFLFIAYQTNKMFRFQKYKQNCRQLNWDGLAIQSAMNRTRRFDFVACGCQHSQQSVNNTIVQSDISIEFQHFFYVQIKWKCSIYPFAITNSWDSRTF